MRILALGAHPDDVEMDSGGTLFRFLREGHEVYYAVFSKCLDQPGNESIVEDFWCGIRVLGIPDENVELHNFENTRFHKNSAEIREIMERIKDEFKPDIVLTRSCNDIHQDHQTIYMEGARVFRYSTLLGSDCIRSNLHFNPNCYVRLTQDDVQNKINLLNCFKSQMRRDYVSEEILMGEMIYRGSEVGVSFAEAFEVIRIVQ